MLVASRIKSQRRVLAQLMSSLQLPDQPACAFFKEQVLKESPVIKILLNCALCCLSVICFFVISPVAASFPVLMMTASIG